MSKFIVLDEEWEPEDGGFDEGTKEELGERIFEDMQGGAYGCIIVPLEVWEIMKATGRRDYYNIKKELKNGNI